MINEVILPWPNLHLAISRMRLLVSAINESCTINVKTIVIKWIHFLIKLRPKVGPLHIFLAMLHVVASPKADTSSREVTATSREDVATSCEALKNLFGGNDYWDFERIFITFAIYRVSDLSD